MDALNRVWQSLAAEMGSLEVAEQLDDAVALACEAADATEAEDRWAAEWAEAAGFDVAGWAAERAEAAGWVDGFGLL